MENQIVRRMIPYAAAVLDEDGKALQRQLESDSQEENKNAAPGKKHLLKVAEKEQGQGTGKLCIDHTYLAILSSLGAACSMLALPAVVIFFDSSGQSDVERALLLEAAAETLCRYDGQETGGRLLAQRVREKAWSDEKNNKQQKPAPKSHWLLYWMGTAEQIKRWQKGEMSTQELQDAVLERPDPIRINRCRDLLTDAICALKLAMQMYTLEDNSQNRGLLELREEDPAQESDAQQTGQEEAETVTPLPLTRGVNLHYLYNVDYFYQHDIGQSGKDSTASSGTSGVLLPAEDSRRRRAYERYNQRILDSCWKASDRLIEKVSKDEKRIVLTVQYPGLLMGLGYLHQAEVGGGDVARAQIKMGFTFDYVTGLPYLPGSSVKGILRSAFREHQDLVRALLTPNDAPEDWRLSDALLREMEQKIFGQAAERPANDDSPMPKREKSEQDVFLDAFPVETGREDRLIGDDYVTSHRNKARPDFEGLTGVRPVRMLRVLPGVKFCFRFVLGSTAVTDQDGNQCILEPEVKRELFSALLQVLGAGARGNVGYGRLVEDTTGMADGDLHWLIPDIKRQPTRAGKRPELGQKNRRRGE